MKNYIMASALALAISISAGSAAWALQDGPYGSVPNQPVEPGMVAGKVVTTTVSKNQTDNMNQRYAPINYLVPEQGLAGHYIDLREGLLADIYAGKVNAGRLTADQVKRYSFVDAKTAQDYVSKFYAGYQKETRAGEIFYKNILVPPAGEPAAMFGLHHTRSYDSNNNRIDDHWWIGKAASQ